MSKKTSYNKAVCDARKDLPTTHQLLSRFFHVPVVEVTLASLEKTIFRIVPILFGFVAALTVSLLSIAIAYFYGYHIVSLSFVMYVFGLGFIVGTVFEYIRSLIRQIQ